MLVFKFSVKNYVTVALLEAFIKTIPTTIISSVQMVSSSNSCKQEKIFTVKPV